MTLAEAVKESKLHGCWFQRPKWHYVIFWCEELGYFTSGYNAENCSFINIEDAIATDYILCQPIDDSFHHYGPRPEDLK